jgi:hypothetical protein
MILSTIRREVLMGLRRKSASFCLKIANFYKFHNDFNDF